jgi:predicted enzyme related to lactoylglutathione lyase
MAQVLVNIDVDDLAAGERFYTAAFQLRAGRRFGEEGVELLGAEAPIYLLVRRAGTQPFDAGQARREYRRHWTPVHVDFVVDDLDAALARALGAGATLELGVYDRPYGRLAILADPFGHGFCLLQFTGRGYDAIATNA